MSQENIYSPVFSSSCAIIIPSYIHITEHTTAWVGLNKQTQRTKNLSFFSTLHSSENSVSLFLHSNPTVYSSKIDRQPTRNSIPISSLDQNIHIFSISILRKLNGRIYATALPLPLIKILLLLS